MLGFSYNNCSEKILRQTFSIAKLIRFLQEFGSAKKVVIYRKKPEMFQKPVKFIVLPV